MKPPLKLDRPVALVGMMAAGKSAAGRVLAERLGIRFFDSDEEVERRAGATVAELFEREGEAGFRKREREALEDLLQRGPGVIAVGGGAMADVGSRSLLLERSLTIWLQAEPEVLLARLGDSRSRPLLRGAESLRTLQKLLEERTPHYRRAAIHVRSGEGSVEATAERLVEALERHLSRA